MNQPAFIANDNKSHAMENFRIPKRQHKLWKERIAWPYYFPWRKEQLNILKDFQSNDWKQFIIQAVFGGGKTTMIIAMLFDLVLQKKATVDEIMVSAFNVAIKNEIKKKIKVLGKFYPRTFDSIVYEICREMEYPDLKHPNFLEKRKFLFQQLDKIPENPNMKFVFLDEAQDLENSVLLILKKRFPNARMVIVGDIFQSIQKEPRESLLWRLLNSTPTSDMKIFQMTTTPRVPHLILDEVKTALYDYYPEFQKTIDSWKSSCAIDSKGIDWSTFKDYNHVFQQMHSFVETHGYEKSMILVFSSAITVRGSLGDVSRVRRFFVEKNIPVNPNHKMMHDNSVFLSTVNSSKGLEREHVFCLLTFPLELAFANFSSDVLMNLLTVGMSRCKRSVHFCIPSYMDRFSPILKFYKNCPKPKQQLTQQKLAFSEKKQFLNSEKCTDKTYMLPREHSATEILRLQMLSFETKQILLRFAKKYDETIVPTTNIIIKTEEDASLVGLTFETLILSTLKKNWQTEIKTIDDVGHSCYQTYFKRIHKIFLEYSTFIRMNPFMSCSVEKKIHGAVLYAKLYLAFHNKVFCNFQNEAKIREQWVKIEPIIKSSTWIPRDLDRLKTQEKVGMSFVNGVVDAMFVDNKDSKSLMEIFEIKASRQRDWLEQALLQAILYGLSQGKTFFRIHLMNIMSKKWQHYYINFEEQRKDCLLRITSDIQLYNLNCYLSKNRTTTDETKKNLNIQNVFFIDGRQEKKLYLYEMTSPTKISIICKCETPEQVSNFWERRFKIYVQQWKIKKILVGRCITQNIPSEKLNLVDFRFLQKKNVELNWETYLIQMGWYKEGNEIENNLNWENVLSSTSIEISELCDTFNLIC